MRYKLQYILQHFVSFFIYLSMFNNSSDSTKMYTVNYEHTFKNGRFKILLPGMSLSESHHKMMPLRNTVTPLHCSPLQNATISNMKSDNCKALQKKM
jgi:hypothetical protein